ncbi:MAG TPA: hypothetical protein VK772_01760 [Puia sp.]|nr:hypothetical protein [Puia sp.]
MKNRPVYKGPIQWADLGVRDFNGLGYARIGLRPLRDLANKYETCIVIIHHTIKHSENSEPNKNRLNGSQGIEASLRSVVELRLGEGELAYLTILKGNFISRKEKNKSYELSFDEETLSFSATGKCTDSNKLSQQNRRSKYDNPEMIRDFVELKKKGFSYEFIIGELVKKYGENKVPGKTWFIDKYKSMVSQSENKEKDRPTGTK